MNFTSDTAQYLDTAAITRQANKQINQGVIVSQAISVLTPALKLVEKAISDAPDGNGVTARVKLRSEIVDLLTSISGAPLDGDFTDITGWSHLYLRRMVIAAAREANSVVAAGLADRLPYDGILADMASNLAQIVTVAANTAVAAIAYVPAKLASAVPWSVWIVVVGALGVGVYLAFK